MEDTMVTACCLQNQSCFLYLFFSSPTGTCSCSFVRINWAPYHSVLRYHYPTSILLLTTCCSDDRHFRAIYCLYFIMITENIMKLNLSIWLPLNILLQRCNWTKTKAVSDVFLWQTSKNDFIGSMKAYFGLTDDFISGSSDNVHYLYNKTTWQNT